MNIELSPFVKMQELMDLILEVRYSEPKREYTACQALYEIAMRENYTYGIAFAVTYLADYAIGESDSVQGGQYLNQAKRLCQEHGYLDLLLRVYNLLGICYESLSDEQTALQFYIEALKLLETQYDPRMKCIILNNIATDFGYHHDYEEAKKYYLQAYELVLAECRNLTDFDYILVRLWGNLADIYYKEGDLEKTRQYLQMGEKLETSESLHKEYLLCRGWCCYLAATGEADGAERYAEKLLGYSAQEEYDRYFWYEMLISAGEAMILTGNQQCVRRILDRILSRCVGEEVARMQQVKKLMVTYSETFGTQEDCETAYREYYKTMLRAEEVFDQVRVNGMRAKLLLSEAIREKDEAMREKQEMGVEAHLDELTGLYNRRSFHKLLSKAVYSGNRVGIGFIMVDVDYFKEYNDTYGHTQGDEALRAVAEILRVSAGERLHVCRYGGDEFVCLCQGMSGKEIQEYAVKVQQKLMESALEHRGSRCADVLTLSMGFSVGSVRTTREADALLEEADKALYRVKTAGRNSCLGAMGPGETQDGQDSVFDDDLRKG